MGTYLRWALIRIGCIFEVGTFRGGYLFEVGTYLTLGAYSNKFGNISSNFFKLFFSGQPGVGPAVSERGVQQDSWKGGKKSIFGLGWGGGF